MPANEVISFNMKTIKTVTNIAIEQHLKKIGGGNHKDNMEQVLKYKHCLLVELSESDFFNLVFLDIAQTKQLIDRAGSRKLADIASVANNHPVTNLGLNWDLADIITKTNNFANKQTVSIDLINTYMQHFSKTSFPRPDSTII